MNKAQGLWPCAWAQTGKPVFVSLGPGIRIPDGCRICAIGRHAYDDNFEQKPVKVQAGSVQIQCRGDDEAHHKVCGIVGRQRVPSRIREAYRIAEEEKPRLCILNSPKTLLMSKQKSDRFRLRWFAGLLLKKKRLTERCRRSCSQSPIIIIGAEAIENDVKMLTEFIDKAGIPSSLPN